MDLHLNRVIHLNKVMDLPLNKEVMDLLSSNQAMDLPNNNLVMDLPNNNLVMDLLNNNLVMDLPNNNQVMDLCQVNSSFLEDHPFNSKVIMDLHPLSSKALHPLWVSKWLIMPCNRQMVLNRLLDHHKVKHKLQVTLDQMSQIKMWMTTRMPHPLPQVHLLQTCLVVMQDMRMLILVLSICRLHRHMNHLHSSRHQNRISNRPQLYLKTKQGMHCWHL